MSIDVIDLFAGPGGLGEGFASLDDGRKFKIAVSVEMEASAHQTLMLRSFFRHARGYAKAERAYYDFCNSARAKHPRDVCPGIWEIAEAEACQLTLGRDDDNAKLNQIIDKKRLNPDRTIVIGGPPCQAYSLVGRAKNKGTIGYVAERDHRHYLYQEYLRILDRYRPALFVMENVKGILSAQVGGRRVFHDILNDLSNPARAAGRRIGAERHAYRVHSLVVPSFFELGMDAASFDAHDFVVRSELYGVPQARHRVILVGVRQDLISASPPQLVESQLLTVNDAISELPVLRSKVSKVDDPAKWFRTVVELAAKLAVDAKRRGQAEMADTLLQRAQALTRDGSVGGLRVEKRQASGKKSDYLSWVRDNNLDVWLNHEARSHMASDLGRYFYATVFAELHNRSPKGHAEFMLRGLAPEHANWHTGKFSDRFRVQRYGAPSTTVTSHIAKDGHYFIHPDPTQCRSLTVREAARLQSFPDNCFFQGNRTQQYHQVGNAVPPLLAMKIARAVLRLMR